MSEPEELSVPRSPAALTPRWLTGALRASGALAEGRVTTVEARVVGQDMGFSSTLFRLRLGYDSPGGAGPGALIAKFPSVDPTMRAWVQLYQGYEREVRFFLDLAPLCPVRTGRCFYAGMEEPAGEPARNPDRRPDRRLARSLPGWLQALLVPLARRWAGLRKRPYLLLLEDLGAKRLGDQIEGADVADAERVALALARLHATFWDGAGLSNTGWLPTRIGGLPGVRSAYRRNRERFYRTAAAPPPPRFIELMEWADGNLAPILRGLTGAPVTLLHGDCGLENVFFEGDGVWLIDWQSVAVGPGILDWVHFVVGSLRRSVGADDELALLETYHGELCARGVSGYDLDDCRRHYGLAKLFLALTMVGWPDWNGPRTERLDALLRRRHERLFARLPEADWSACLD